MDNLTAGNPRAHRIRVYYEGESTINQGMPLCYNYLTTDNWWGGSVSAGAVSATTTTAEGSQNEGKYIRVIEPLVINAEDYTPAASSKVITGDEDETNNIKVNHWVTITGTDVTAGTYKVTAVTAGVDGDDVDGTITLDMDDATSTTADVTVSADNSLWYAGAVAPGGWVGQTGPRVLDIYVPNGAIIPVRTDKSCVIGDTLGLGSGEFSSATGNGDPVPCATSMEVVDRSSVTGLVLAKTFDTGQQIYGGQMYFAPRRATTTGDAYGIRINLDNFYTSTGTSGPRSWGVGIHGWKSSGTLSTAGCDDAALRIDVSTATANTSVYNWRGLNVCANNRGGGTVGELTNIISVAAKQLSTTSLCIGCKIDVQHLSQTGTTAQIGGLDVAVNREGSAGTLEYGIQVRTRGSINTKLNSALYFAKGTDYGFSYLFNVDAAATLTIAAQASTSTQQWGTDDITIPILVAGTPYYIYASIAAAAA